MGSGRFAHVNSMRIPNADPIFLVDEKATRGSFVLHATVAAGTESTAEKLAPVLTAKLVHRLRQLLDGHLHGTPAKLPRLPAPGVADRATTIQPSNVQTLAQTMAACLNAGLAG